MKKRKFIPKRKLEFIQSARDKFIDEEMEWINLTPIQRILETTKLWQKSTRCCDLWVGHALWEAEWL